MAHQHPTSTPLGAQACHLTDAPLHEETTTKQNVLDTAAGALQSFAPINNICTYLCALHAYGHDIGRQVIAHHYCSHVTKDMHQCIIYDSNKPDARLIGIEYLISEKLFNNLDAEEKQYWHSHKFEVSSGMLVAPGLPERAEREFCIEVQAMYGKIIHTWEIDRHPQLPLGPPKLMTSITADWQLDAKLMAEKDEITGISSEQRSESRAEIPYTPKAEGADAWETTGQGIQFVPQKEPMKVPVKEGNRIVDSRTEKSTTEKVTGAAATAASADSGTSAPSS